MKNIFMIASVSDKTYAIGNRGELIFHIKEDLEFFRSMTLNNTVVMGYKTYMSLPVRPFKNRNNIVLTRNDRILPGTTVMKSADEVLDYANKSPKEKIFICGGEEIYKLFMPYADILYITEISENNPVVADAFFPNIDNTWKVDYASEKKYCRDLSYIFKTYVRV